MKGLGTLLKYMSRHIYIYVFLVLSLLLLSCDNDDGSGNGYPDLFNFEHVPFDDINNSDDSGNSNDNGSDIDPNKKDDIDVPPERVPIDQVTEANYNSYDNEKVEWSFKRQLGNIQSGTYEPFKINDYNAYYLNPHVTEEDKVIYLTFDCGYENGFTPTILDTLKKHGIKAMFFITKHFLRDKPEYVTRMKEEGHMVGNHTQNHPSLPTLSMDKLKDEVLGLEDLMLEQTGYTLDFYLRPPMGEYSKRTLKVLQDLGYRTIFWSIAYVDYDIENQPGKAYVLEHFTKYHHNGAIPLLHNVSESNTEALDELILYLKAEGYRFGTLDELEY